MVILSQKLYLVNSLKIIFLHFPTNIIFCRTKQTKFRYTFLQIKIKNMRLSQKLPLIIDISKDIIITEPQICGSE